MRSIHQIKDLPISQLTDEEIAKAAMHRLNANFAMLIYIDRDDKDKGMQFLARWRNKEGKGIWKQLSLAWEEKFGIKVNKNK